MVQTKNMKNQKSPLIKFLGKLKFDSILLVVLCLLLVVSLTRNSVSPRYAMNSYVESAMDYDTGYRVAGNALSKMASPASSNIEPPIMDGGVGGAQSGEKIEKNGYVNVEVEPRFYETKLSETRSLLTSFDGYIQNENEYTNLYNEKKYRTTSMSIKVPVEHFDALYAQLKNIGEMQSANFNINDRTTQYYDVKSYLDEYVAQKEKVLALLDRAEDITDIIEIEKHLTEVQIKIDQYTSQLNAVERKTSYSTVSFTIQEKIPVKSQLYIVKGKEIAQSFVTSFNNAVLFVMKNFVLLVLIGVTSFVILRRKRRS